MLRFTTKPEGSGTGGGLSLSHAIVAAHDGTIALDERSGQGATFVVRIPVGFKTADARCGGEERPPSGTAPRILIVDDERDVAETIAEIVAPMAQSVDLASDGIEALRRLNARSYDLIISDLRMPKLDGPSFFRLAQEGGRTERFIFVTGDTLSAHLSSFVKEAGVRVVEKPVVPEMLREIVRSALS